MKAVSGAGRIALGYAVFAMLWIAFSDAVVSRLKLPEFVNTIKGTLFVIVTGSLLYFTVRRLVRAVQRTSQERDETAKRAEEAQRRLNRELRAISNCNQVLLRATDEQSLLKEVCRIVCEEAGYRTAWVGYAEHDEAKTVRPVAWTGAEEAELNVLGVSWADDERGSGPGATAIRTGKTSQIEDYSTDPRIALWRENALHHGFHSAIGLPLQDEQAKTFGCLCIYSGQPHAFAPEEIRLLEELAADLAFGIVTLRSRAARQQAEQEVVTLSFALDKVGEAALLTDESGRIHYVNERACHGLGYSRAELLGLSVADIDPEFPAERWPEHWRDLKVRRSLRFESRHRTRDGRIFPVEISANYFEYGGQPYNLALVRDITERKRAEETLRESETRFRTFVDHATDAFILLDEQSKIVDVNRQACESLGYTREELIGLAPGDIDPNANEAFLQHISEQLDAGAVFTFETRHRRKDGTVFPVEVRVRPFVQGGHRFHLAFARDITERKRTEEELRRSEAYLAEGQRLSRMGSWAWSADKAGRHYWSEEMFRIFGFGTKEGTPALEKFLERIHPEDYGRVTMHWEKTLRDQADLAVDFRIVLPDGTIRDIYIIGHPVLDRTGKTIEYVGTAVDITERKRAEEELRKHRENLEELVKQRTEELAEAKARAEAASRAKGAFLANMSHELRTPLNAVLGFSRLLKKDPAATPQQQETLDVIVRSGEHLLNLINNVLDMAKIEAGRVPLKESEADLIQLLHEMQSLMGAGAADKGLRFALECDSDLPRYVVVDAGKLRQVLLNLLGNAIKFTETGGVKLRARLASLQGPDKARMRFEVEDSGPGLVAEDCERIFDPFVQLSDRTSAQAGTGLGLSICKEYVELMGGRIGVTSQPGKGSIFHFEIPLRILPAAAERDELKHGRILGLVEGQPRYRLLIVEDQPENRLLLRRTLDPLGFELREAANGQEAVALFEQWQPHLIWMDIRMPVMDGLEAVRWIRATTAGQTTKIVALTAHALDEEREPIMAAGCDDLVRKPFHEQELLEALARHLRLKFIYEKTPSPLSAPTTTGPQPRAEQLDALPAQLRQDLRQAVVELDTARTQTLIEQVAQHDAVLGKALADLAKQLDYKRLLKLLEKES